MKMKLGWQQAGPSCDDAQCVGTLTTSSVCDTRGLEWVNGEPARHLINIWTSSAWDTHQLLVAVGHQCNDKPLRNTASGLSNYIKMRLEVQKKGYYFSLFFLLYGSSVVQQHWTKHNKETQQICVFCFVILFYPILLCFTHQGHHTSTTSISFKSHLILTSWFYIVCCHSLPPHLFEGRAHLLTLCNGMNNIHN